MGKLPQGQRARRRLYAADFMGSRRHAPVAFLFEGRTSF
jgi:hypothetical protein